ncbi:MAG: hypothetical protein V3U85_10260 [Hyphomicrobium sp.]
MGRLNDNSLKYVTWRHFVSIGIGVVVIPVLVVLWLAFDTLREDILEMRRELKDDIGKVQETIDEIHPRGGPGP